jgi:hypothetical protein
VNTTEFSHSQLGKIAALAGPDRQKAMEQFESDFGPVAQARHEFKEKHDELCKAWELFCNKKDNGSLHKFFCLQAPLEVFYESCWGDSASQYFEPLSRKMTGVKYWEAMGACDSQG